MNDKSVKLVEASRVKQQINAFSSSQFALGMLVLDPLSSTAQLGLIVQLS
jgi:hypothetical protein